LHPFRLKKRQSMMTTDKKYRGLGGEEEYGGKTGLTLFGQTEALDIEL